VPPAKLKTPPLSVTASVGIVTARSRAETDFKYKLIPPTLPSPPVDPVGSVNVQESLKVTPSLLTGKLVFSNVVGVLDKVPRGVGSVE
jgi:hypothetical protein